MNEWRSKFITNWIRYYGRLLTIVTDQTDVVISEMFRNEYDAYGSETHTRTGVVEQRLGIVKVDVLQRTAHWLSDRAQASTAARRYSAGLLRVGLVLRRPWELRLKPRACRRRKKLYAQTQCQGLRMGQDECVYNWDIPNMALLGHGPRDLYAIDKRAPMAYKDVRSSRPDSLGSSIRDRVLAKDNKLAEAINAKVQQDDQSTLDNIAAVKLIDIWKGPNAKDKYGWRGPVEMINPLSADGNQLSVMFKNLMEFVEDLVPDQIFIYGHL